jgi:FkbM family methyltransferase
MVCFDVGANIGVTTVQMARKVGPEGMVHAFEPIPWLHERIDRNLARNQFESRVRLNRAALSDESGEIDIWAGEPAELNHGMASIMLGRCDNLTVPIRTPALTLDGYVEKHCLEKVDLIKIDVQGAELRLLTSGTQTLRRLRPKLVIEVSPGDLVASGVTGRDLLQHIAGCGYRVHTLARNGPGPAIDVDHLPSDFTASNVICVPTT